jgi:uncharacterized protein (TIGR02001 family)
MKKANVLKASVLAAALAPSMGLAEISGSLGISSQYLWRGQQLTFGPTVNGSVDYAHESGLYAGAWTSSESGDTEYDLYGGFGGSAGELTYDISYIDYNYTAGGTNSLPAAPVEASSADFEEVHVGVGFANFAFDAYIGLGDYGHPSSGEGTDNNDNYYSVSYGYDKFGALVGMYDFDGDPEDPEQGVSNAPDYTHLDVSYAVTDQFTFLVSKIISQQDIGGVDPWDDDVVMSVSYSFEL